MCSDLYKHKIEKCVNVVVSMWQVWWHKLLKFNSLPLKIYWDTKGKDRLPASNFYQFYHENNPYLDLFEVIFTLCHGKSPLSMFNIVQPPIKDQKHISIGILEKKVHPFSLWVSHPWLLSHASLKLSWFFKWKIFPQTNIAAWKWWSGDYLYFGFRPIFLGAIWLVLGRVVVSQKTMFRLKFRCSYGTVGTVPDFAVFLEGTK